MTRPPPSSPLFPSTPLSRSPRLYTEVQERLREATTLMNVGQILSRPGPAAERMRQVAREVALACGADMVGAYFLDDRKEKLAPLGGYQVPPELLDRKSVV